MKIRQFLNFKYKNVDNDIEIVIDEIIKAYSISNKTYKIDKKDVIMPKIGYLKIMQTLKK